jgi:farnesyl diphosphate synthase
VSVLGLEGAARQAQTLRERAQDALASSGLRHTARLSWLADLVVDRNR